MVRAMATTRRVSAAREATAPPTTTTTDTRQRIIHAGLTVITRGEPFALGEIAREAGISRQALYLHFESRAALAVAVAQYTDELFGVEQALAPVREATDAASLLRAQARFVTKYNERLYPVVRMADALLQTDLEMAAPWQDRLASRRAGGRAIAARLEQWGVLSDEWTVETAGDWICALASVKLWKELIIDLRWSKERFARSLELQLSSALLRSPPEAPAAVAHSAKGTGKKSRA
jgi:AcrR family transcriptional regulator